ncbi:MAG: response regulator [Verrucomicrobiota bacterium]
MKHILFVEDNPILLQMCAMMLEGDTDWEVSTAADGAAALELLTQRAFDVVASDMRMPGMSGLELLEKVRTRHPHTSRIIISGIGDQEEVARSLHSNHQFLAKPFTVKTLRATLGRLNGLDTYLKDEKLKALVGRMNSLPSFPSVYLKIMKEIDSPHAALENIADIVGKDPSLSAKTLQVVNSAAFGLPDKIHDPFEAVQQLGMNSIRSFALASHIFSKYEPTQAKGLDPVQLWEHLMKTSKLAEAIMRSEGAEGTEVDDAATAAMLHDMGKLMLAENLPDEFHRANRLAAEQNIPLAAAELEVFGTTHAGAAAYLLGLWGLPATIVEAVAFHHAPSASQFKEFGPLTAVHAANALQHELSKNPADGINSSLDESYLASIGFADHVALWKERALELTSETADS